VVDISHPQFEDHYRVVNETLQEIGAGDKPVLLVFNKIDAYTYVPLDEDDLSERTVRNYSLEELKSTWMAKLPENDILFISATKKQQLEAFKDQLYERVREIHITRYPFNDFLYDEIE
jgi:GTP-binding protein HflX